MVPGNDDFYAPTTVGSKVAFEGTPFAGDGGIARGCFSNHGPTHHSSLWQPVAKVPRGQAQRISIAGKARRRVILARKYGEEEQRSTRSKNASWARATFATGCLSNTSRRSPPARQIQHAIRQPHTNCKRPSPRQEAQGNAQRCRVPATEAQRSPEALRPRAARRRQNPISTASTARRGEACLRPRPPSRGAKPHIRQSQWTKSIRSRPAPSSKIKANLFPPYTAIASPPELVRFPPVKSADRGKLCNPDTILQCTTHQSNRLKCDCS